MDFSLLCLRGAREVGGDVEKVRSCWLCRAALKCLRQSCKKIDFDLSFAFFLLVNYLMTDCLVVDLSFAEKIFEFLFKFKRRLILYNLLFDEF